MTGSPIVTAVPIDAGPAPFGVRLWSALLGALLLGCAACHSTPGPPPFVMPALEQDTLHRVGGLLTNVRVAPDAEALAPDDCLSVRVRWFVLREISGPGGLDGDGLASRAELVARLGGQRVLSPTPRLARSATVILPSEGRDPLAEVEERLARGGARLVAPSAALPPGTTAQFDLIDPAASLRVERGKPGTEVVRILVHRSPATDEAGGEAPAPEELSVALGVVGWEPVLLPQDEEPAVLAGRAGRKATAGTPPPTEVVESLRELVVLQDRLRVDGPPLVVAMPVDFASGAAGGLAAAISVATAPAPESPGREEHEAALDRCAAELAAAALDESDTSPTFIGLTEAFVGLELPATRRASLSHLAHRSGALLAAELALALDESLLAAYTQRLLAALPYGPPPGDDGRALGWELERQALILLSEQLAVPDPDVVLEAVLLRRLGETGRHPSYVKRLAERVSDLAQLDERLVDQNLLWLEDPSPAARVRAHDWLLERGLVPPGYDPLGSREQRRAALSSFHEASGS